MSASIPRSQARHGVSVRAALATPNTCSVGSMTEKKSWKLPPRPGPFREALTFIATAAGRKNAEWWPLVVTLPLVVVGVYVMLAADGKKWWLPGRQTMLDGSVQRLMDDPSAGMTYMRRAASTPSLMPSRT